MADHQEHPAVPIPMDPLAAATETPPNQTSPVKKVRNWIRGKTSSKTKQGLKSLKSQLTQFVAPDGSKINMEILPSDIAVHTIKNEDGELIFNQEVGTRKSAKGQHFIAFTTLPDLPPPTSRWILGTITESTTSRKRATNTKFAENWHNFLFHKALSGPEDWQDLVGTGKSINLKLGTAWCIISLNVPITELDMSISSPEGQTPSYLIGDSITSKIVIYFQRSLTETSCE